MLDSYDVVYESVYELASSMLELYDDCEDGQEVVCIGNHEMIRTLISQLIFYTDGELEIAYSDLNKDYVLRPEMNEYVLTLYEGYIFVSPMRKNKDVAYEEFHATYLLIHNDCNSKILRSVINYDCIALCFNFEDELEFDYEDEEAVEEIGEDKKNKCNCTKEYCDNCNCTHDKEEASVDTEDSDHGFTVSKNTDQEYFSFSFYSSDKSMVDDMLEFFKRKF